jgi:hypothetical protein
MKKLRLMVLAAVVGVSANVAMAQASAPAQTKAQAQERIYGSQLMTEQERNEYRLRMRELKTEAERLQFRTEHHARMQERAKERGMTLPDEPPMQGQGAGPRAGSQSGGSPGAGPRGAGGGGGRP